MSNSLKFFNFIKIQLLFVSLVVALSCGEERPAVQNDLQLPKSEQAFRDVSKQNSVPYRMMVAVSFLESQINPKASFSLYGGRKVGLDSAQTAFGLSRGVLSLGDHPEADSLPIQIEAYGRWLVEQTVDIDLKAYPTTQEEKFAWIWELAQLHRQGVAGRQNIRVFFALELMSLLNEGFSWQSPDSQELIHFPKESPPLRVKDFSEIDQQLLKLNIRRSEVNSAVYLPLTGTRKYDQRFVPKGVEIIHCPYNISICLEMQNSSSSQEVGLFEGHYLIPSDPRFTDVPVQLSRHDQPVRILNPDGSISLSDKLVVVLTGPSGRVVEGERQTVNPLWLTKWQLQRMAELVNDVCVKMFTDYGEQLAFSVEQCQSVGQALHLRVQEKRSLYQWGDISDFDASIFASYLEHPEGLAGATLLRATQMHQLIDAGRPISFSLFFQLRAQKIVVEQLVRCPLDRSVRWSFVTRDSVRSKSSYSFQKSLFDAGPNSNGDHFLRAKVYSKEGLLLGWDIIALKLKNYEPLSDTEYYPECE